MPFYCLQAIKNSRIQIRNGWGLSNGWGKRSRKWKNKKIM
nr:MAG TPA: Adipokinetic hormone [Caudoviricetes sp.]